MLVLVFVVILLGLAVTPVEARRNPSPTHAYYASNWYSDLFQEEPTVIQNFSDIRDGVTVLQDGVFVPKVQGLIRVTAHCEMKFSPTSAHLVLTPLNNPSFGYVYHAEGVDVVELTAVFDAGPFTVAGWQTGVGALRSRCTVLVEQVQ